MSALDPEEQQENWQLFSQLVYATTQEETQDLWACFSRLLKILNHKDLQLPDDVQEDVETIEQFVTKWY